MIDPDLPLIDPETLSKMWKSAYNFDFEKFDILLTGTTKGEVFPIHLKPCIMIKALNNKQENKYYNFIKNEFEKLLKSNTLHQSDCYNLHEFKPYWDGELYADFDFLKDIRFIIEVFDKGEEYPDRWCSFSRKSEIVDNTLFSEEEYLTLKEMCDKIFEKVDYSKIFDNKRHLSLDLGLNNYVSA